MPKTLLGEEEIELLNLISGMIDQLFPNVQQMVMCIRHCPDETESADTFQLVVNRCTKREAKTMLLHGLDELKTMAPERFVK